MPDNSKLLLITDSFGSGGTQRQVINLCIGLQSMNVNFSVVALNSVNDYPKLLEENRISPKVIHVKNKIKKMYLLSRYISNHKPSCIIAFLPFPSFYTLVSTVFSRKIKVIISERSFEEDLAPFHHLVTRRLYWRANFIVANSQRQTDILRTKFERVKFIPNGISKSMFHQRNDYVRNRTILAIGRVSSLKNPVTLIEALFKFNTNNKMPYNVIWVGDTAEYLDHYEYCIELLEKYELNDYWIWTGKTEEIKRYIDMADCLYHGSLGEGFPNVICEAMARETIVIASDVCDHSKVVEDGKNGFLFDPKSASELLKKIEKLESLSDYEYRDMSVLAYETVLSRFSLESMTKSYIALVNSER